MESMNRGAVTPSSSSPESRPIFRPTALRAFVERREKAVVPRWIAPRFLRWVWALAALSCLAAAPLLLSEIPIYAPAIAVLDDAPGHSGALRVLVPAARTGSDLLGHRVLVGRDGEPDRAVAVVTSVRPGVLSPDQVRARYGALPLIAPGFAPPVVVVDATWTDGSPAWAPTAAAAGAWQPAEVEVFTCKVVSLIRQGAPR